MTRVDDFEDAPRGHTARDVEDASETHGSTPEPLERVPPVESRFLFVDIAAQRAKQLRRGARPRLTEAEERRERSERAERVAIREVAEGLVPYTLPDSSAGTPEATAS